MFEELLSYHQPPTYPNGAEYWIEHTIQLYRLGLDWATPQYPEEWFAGQWERKAIRIINNLARSNVEVSSKTVADAYIGAAG